MIDRMTVQAQQKLCNQPFLILCKYFCKTFHFQSQNLISNCPNKGRHTGIMEHQYFQRGADMVHLLTTKVMLLT